MRTRRLPQLLVALLSLFSAFCATQTVTLRTIPQPLASPRLRVFVQPLESGSRWRISYPAYADAILGGVSKVWRATGMCEVVPAEDVDTAAGTTRRSLEWKARNYELARRVASALWAEYAILVERTESNQQYSFTSTLINARTGAVFEVTMRVPGGTRDDYPPVIQAAYRQLFSDARHDMLATARLKRDSAGAPAAAVSGQAAPAPISRSIDFAAGESQSRATGTRIPVAVYDFDSKEEDLLLSSILSEALRAELAAQGRFELVSREALDRILEELSLQLSGALDESQAVKVGRGVAARQILVGHYGAVGSLSVIQVKRIDVETQKILGVGSLRCPAGREEELLAGMAGLAAGVSTDD